MDREKVIKTLTDALSAKENYPWAKAEMSFEFIEMLLELLKEQEAQKFFVDESGKITPLPVVVRCKDCKNSGLDSSGNNGYWCSAHTEWHDGNWFCADGKRFGNSEQL